MASNKNKKGMDRDKVMNKARLTLVTLLLFSPFSFACSCEEKTLEQYFAEADMVFFARLTDAMLLEGDDSLVNTGSRMVEGHYELKETFKGNPVNGGRIFEMEYNGPSCSVGMVVSEHYIFFTGKDLLVNACNGTSRYQGTGQLEELRELAAGQG